MIPSVVTKQSEGKEKVHLSFLHAFRSGYEEFKDQFGQSIQTNMHDFQGYVAEESKSCFVESIDLYYDCSFTRKGVTLVDTPGADSINARHTGVAFEYIKDSDAILFVTYYNHAFSKADREFLIQLGRVKDTFELDKMFFIVNAIDLASSPQEVEDVLEYVNSQLTEYGIRFPRIFGISSKMAQIPEMRDSSKVDLFLGAFTDFLENDLTKMAVQSANFEYERAVKMLDQMIASASEDEDKKTMRKKKLLSNKERINKWLDETGTGPAPDRLSQEGQELVFYVKQRVFYRLSDFFKEAFNPALLTQNSRELLRKALDEYTESAGFDLAQEMRATSLRMEQFVIKLLNERFEQLNKEIQSIDENLAVSIPEIEKAAALKFSPAFENANQKDLEAVFKYFKNPKSFFEKNDKKQMEQSLETLLSPMADDYLEHNLSKLDEQYQFMLQKEFSCMVNTIRADVNEQYDAWLLAFEDTGKLNHWISIHKKLTIENERS